MQFLAKVNKQGILSIIDAHYPRYKYHLMSLANKTVEIVIRKEQKMSTDLQRKYYWGGILGTLGESIGYNPKQKKDMNDLHEMMKWQFLTYFDKKLKCNRVHSTEKLTTIERNEYHEKIRSWSQEFHNCYIPLPDEWDKQNKEFVERTEELFV